MLSNSKQEHQNYIAKTLEFFREKIAQDDRFAFTTQVDDDNRLKARWGVSYHLLVSNMSSLCWQRMRKIVGCSPHAVDIELREASQVDLNICNQAIAR